MLPVMEQVPRTLSCTGLLRMLPVHWQHSEATTTDLAAACAPQVKLLERAEVAQLGGDPGEPVVGHDQALQRSHLAQRGGQLGQAVVRHVQLHQRHAAAQGLRQLLRAAGQPSSSLLHRKGGPPHAWLQTLQAAAQAIGSHDKGEVTGRRRWTLAHLEEVVLHVEGAQVGEAANE